MRLTSWNHAYDHARYRGLDEHEAELYADALFVLADEVPSAPPDPSPDTLGFLLGYLGDLEPDEPPEHECR